VRITLRAFQDGIHRFEPQGFYTGNKHFLLQDYANTAPEIFFRLGRQRFVRAFAYRSMS
jgi:hypothetical protein